MTCSHLSFILTLHAFHVHFIPKGETVMSIANKILYAAAIGMVFGLTGCSGGSSSGGGASSAVKITGTVSAPKGAGTTGTFAFAEPESRFKTIFANLFTPEAHAVAITGTAPVGAGATISLIEIDSSGNQVGSAIATTTTLADGTYTLDAPSTFAAATKYVVRAISATNSASYLDSIVTSTAVDVDPATHVTKSLVIDAASGVGLSSVTPQIVASIQSDVTRLANDATFVDLSSAKTAIQAQVNASTETSNMVNSLSSTNGIAGTVKDSSGAALPNIKIVVRDFGNWVTRASTLTDASGNYSLPVPNGNYIVGALNARTSSTAASEWWTAGGGANNMYSAGKVTVASNTVTTDFVLDPGVRISGTVTGKSTTLPAQGVLVQLRDFANNQPITQVYTNAAGQYTMNVMAGNYTLGAYNQTIQPYASELYNASLPGGSNSTQAEKVALVVGTPKTADFSLLDGKSISGTITDGVAGAAVAGIVVRFNAYTGAFVNAVRTDNLGKYRFWLRPNSTASQAYVVRARGQTANSATTGTVDISGSSQTVDFTNAMQTVTATLSDGTNPVSQASVSVYDAGTGAYLGAENSNSDGTVTLYTTVNVKLSPSITNGSYIGTQFYNNAATLGSATAVAAGTQNVAITLPAGGVMTGVVNFAATPTADRLVQVRSGGTSLANFVANTRTQSDGSYTISLPAGTYNVRACNPDPTVSPNCSAGVNTAWTTVTITNNATSTSNWTSVN